MKLYDYLLSGIEFRSLYAEVINYIMFVCLNRCNDNSIYYDFYEYVHCSEDDRVRVILDLEHSSFIIEFLDGRSIKFYITGDLNNNRGGIEIDDIIFYYNDILSCILRTGKDKYSFCDIYNNYFRICSEIDTCKEIVSSLVCNLDFQCQINYYLELFDIPSFDIWNEEVLISSLYRYIVFCHSSNFSLDVGSIDHSKFLRYCFLHEMVRISSCTFTFDTNALNIIDESKLIENFTLELKSGIFLLIDNLQHKYSSLLDEKLIENITRNISGDAKSLTKDVFSFLIRKLVSLKH